MLKIQSKGRDIYMDEQGIYIGSSIIKWSELTDISHRDTPDSAFVFTYKGSKVSLNHNPEDYAAMAQLFFAAEKTEDPIEEILPPENNWNDNLSNSQPDEQVPEQSVRKKKKLMIILIFMNIIGVALLTFSLIGTTSNILQDSRSASDSITYYETNDTEYISLEDYFHNHPELTKSDDDTLSIYASGNVWVYEYDITSYYDSYADACKDEEKVKESLNADPSAFETLKSKVKEEIGLDIIISVIATYDGLQVAERTY